MLELKHISYAVREGDSELGILNDISLTIDDHRLVVFTGPNGGGKTTLAKIIMGLVKPTGGQILWNGQDITDLGITERARLGISYGFQQPPRFKGLTVRNLLTIASGNEKLSKDQCCQYLTKVGLCANDYLDREVDASLSGGEVTTKSSSSSIMAWMLNTSAMSSPASASAFSYSAVCCSMAFCCASSKRATSAAVSATSAAEMAVSFFL